MFPSAPEPVVELVEKQNSYKPPSGYDLKRYNRSTFERYANLLKTTFPNTEPKLSKLEGGE